MTSTVNAVGRSYATVARTGLDPDQRVGATPNEVEETDKASRTVRVTATEHVRGDKEIQTNHCAEGMVERVAHDQRHERQATLRDKCEDLKVCFEEATKYDQQEIERLKVQVKELERSLRELYVERNDTVHELQSLHAAHKNMQSLLDIRTAELRDAQVYMSKADSVSYAEVQRAVEGLNAQIFQLSALVTDSFSYSKGRLDEDEVRRAYEEVKRRVGRPAADLLRSTSHNEDPVWVQMGLQAVAVLVTSTIVGSWDLRLSIAGNRLLTRIYTKICAGGRSIPSPGERLTSTPGRTSVNLCEVEDFAEALHAAVENKVRRCRRFHWATHERYEECSHPRWGNQRHRDDGLGEGLLGESQRPCRRKHQSTTDDQRRCHVLRLPAHLSKRIHGICGVVNGGHRELRAEETEKGEGGNVCDVHD